MKITQSYTKTDAISQDELYILRMQLWQIYKARLYATGEHVTTVADLTATFDEHNQFQMDLMWHGRSIFSYHPSTRTIELDWKEWNKILSPTVRGDTPLALAIASILDSLYQREAGQSLFGYTTMTKPVSRRKANDFYHLLRTCKELSDKHMSVGPKFQLREEGHGYSLFDEYGMLIVHVTADWMHFGVGYVTGTDIDANVRYIIDNFRSYVLAIRESYRSANGIFTGMFGGLKNKIDMLNNYAANLVIQAGRPSSAYLLDDQSIIVPSGSRVRITEKLIVIDVVKDGVGKGDLKYNTVTKKIETAPHMWDYLHLPGHDVFLAQVVADAINAYNDCLSVRTNEILGSAALAQLNLSPAQITKVMAGFHDVYKQGYRGNLLDFAQLVLSIN